jgi:hypothetical protein
MFGIPTRGTALSSNTAAAGSTALGAGMSAKHIVSIESDKAWADNLRAYLESSRDTQSSVDLIHVDIGETGPMGTAD